MTNRKSNAVRKINSPQIAVLPPPSPNRTCPPPAKNGTSKHSPPLAKPSAHSESRITHHASRTRNGKVARLPYALRDMINRMLRNNIPHSQIADALDELQFKVTERNISNWKTRGGYRDWCIAQDRALETRLLQDNLLEHLRKNDASQLAEVGLQLAATQLSQFFLKPETREQLTNEPEKLARTIGILCRLARQIHILQKYRDQSAKELGPEHNPERLKHETEETLERMRDVYSAEKIGESINEPDISHRNFLPKNGYPADPPQHDPPRDDTELRMRKFQVLCDAIAAQNAAREAEWQTPPQVPPSPEATGSANEEPSFDDPEGPTNHEPNRKAP